MEWFIQLHKKICNWEWYTDIPTKVLFFHILLKCNYKEVNWRGKTIKLWEFITSIEHLSQETWLSIRQIRTALLHLESTSEVTKQSTSKYTILTLNKWESYNTPIDKPNDKPKTNEWQTKDKPKTITNKEYKEKKKYNNTETTETEVFAENENSLSLQTKPIQTAIENKFNEFLTFRKAIKKEIVPASRDAFLRKLLNISWWDETIAVQILENSIANGWQGIFPIDISKTTQTNKNSISTIVF